MRLSLAVVDSVLVQVRVMAVKHACVEEVVVNCEDFGHDVERVHAEGISGRCLAKHSLEDGEGSLWELVHMDACGDAVVERAGLDDDCVITQAVAVLVEVFERR
jgi:hypothetical protein